MLHSLTGKNIISAVNCMGDSSFDDLLTGIKIHKLSPKILLAFKAKVRLKEPEK